MKNRIIAWLNLAYRFAAHVLWRMPRRVLFGRPDYDRFLALVMSEGYAPLVSVERAAFPDFMGCIHCGLCALACPEIMAAPASAWDEAWTFVVGPARSIERADLVARDLGPCTRCADCAAVCPTGVPITHLATVLQRLAASSEPV